MTTTTISHSETTTFDRTQPFDTTAISAAAANGGHMLQVYPSDHPDSTTEFMSTRHGSITLRDEGNYHHSILHLAMHQEDADEFWTRLERYCAIGGEQFYAQELENAPRGGTYMSDAIHHAAKSSKTLRVFGSSDENYRTWLIVARKGSITIWDTGNHWYSITFVNMEQEDADDFWAELDRYIEQNPHHSLENHNKAQKRYSKFNQLNRRLIAEQIQITNDEIMNGTCPFTDEVRYQDISAILAVLGMGSYEPLSHGK